MAYRDPATSQRFGQSAARSAALLSRNKSWSHAKSEGRTMTRTLYTPSSMPVVPRPDPVLLFIQQAQLTLVYGPGAR